jgi:hypothetical protein
VLDSALMRVLVLALAVLTVLAPTGPASAQGSAVVLHTSTEQIPLNAWAEFRRAGTLVMASGTFSDIPTVTDFRMLRCNLTGWSPMSVMVASEDLFASEYAERRMLPIAGRRVGVTALQVRVADLEQPARVAELLRAVGAGERDNGYFFLVLAAEGLTRYYPFKMKVAR